MGTPRYGALGVWLWFWFSGLYRFLKAYYTQSFQLLFIGGVDVCISVAVAVAVSSAFVFPLKLSEVVVG